MSTRPRTGQADIQVAVTVLDSLSLGISLCILAASVWIRSVPSARHHVQRVSYRIILWVLKAQSVYSVARLLIYTGENARAYSSQYPGLCVTGVYFFIKELHFTNFLTTCIALNLMLIVCFDINPIERKLLRWYVGVSFGLSAFIPIVPAAIGLFGQDPLYRMCYFTPSTVSERMRIVVLCMVLWQVASCVIASIAVAAVLVTLYRQSRDTARALLLGNPINVDVTEEALNRKRKLSTASWTTLSSWTSCAGRQAEKDEENDDIPPVQIHLLQDRVLAIALKISVYPIFLIIVNVITSAADLYFNYELRNGLTSEREAAFLSVYQLLYAGRGLVFAILCITVDPSFRAGLKAAWRARKASHIATPSAIVGGTGHQMSFGHFLFSLTGTTPRTPGVATGPGPLGENGEYQDSHNSMTYSLALFPASPPAETAATLRTPLTSPSLRRSTRFAEVTGFPLRRTGDISKHPHFETSASRGGRSTKSPRGSGRSGQHTTPQSAGRTRHAASPQSGLARTEGLGEFGELEPKETEDDKEVADEKGEVRESEEGRGVEQQRTLGIQHGSRSARATTTPSGSRSGRPGPSFVLASPFGSHSTRAAPSRSSMGSRRSRMRVDWLSEEEAARQFEELNAQL